MVKPFIKQGLDIVVDSFGKKLGALPSDSKNINEYSDIISEGVRLDKPDAYKNLFHADEEFAKGYGGELKVGALKFGSDDIPPQLSDEELKKAKDEVQNLTQEYLADLPDKLTVYRYGDLNAEDGISSFTLDPFYNAKSNLPWQTRLSSPMQKFEVDKKDILASPDINSYFGGGRKFDEQEVIISNDKVQSLPSGNELRKGTKIRIDNPPFLDAITGETYVQRKIRENKEFMERFPNSAPLGTVNGVTGFVDDIRFTPNELIDIKGAAGEEKYRMDGPRMRMLKESIEEKGFDAPEGGDKILIHVREDGMPFISEGNHRVAEAYLSNRPFVNAEIRYLRGSENVDGPLNPRRIGIDFGEE